MEKTWRQMFSQARTSSVLMPFQDLPLMKPFFYIRGQRSSYLTHFTPPSKLKVTFASYGSVSKGVFITPQYWEQPISTWSLWARVWESQLPLAWRWCVGTKLSIWNVLHSQCSHHFTYCYLQGKWPGVKKKCQGKPRKLTKRTIRIASGMRFTMSVRLPHLTVSCRKSFFG